MVCFDAEGLKMLNGRGEGPLRLLRRGGTPGFASAEVGWEDTDMDDS